MASKKKQPKDAAAGFKSDGGDDLSSDLIKAINKEFGLRVAYNLATDESPTHVKRWISTGCTLLDYVVSNRRNGGMPEGRIIEVAGEPSTGKSHIAYQMARETQKMGGLVVYMDTENATPVEKLGELGLDVAKNFVYCDPDCTEDVFKILESTIAKAKSVLHKDIPILAIWDSVAATSPRAELEGDYDDQTIGLQARTISKAMRKITGVIGKNNITFVCINQTRTVIGQMYGDPTTTPGGKAIPFHASVRLMITSAAPIKDDTSGDIIGIHVRATVKKNKVAQPFRKVEFDIIFGRGTSEAESILDILRSSCKKNDYFVDGKQYKVSGDSGWKTLEIINPEGEVLVEKKFQKAGFEELLRDDEYGPYLYDLLEQVMVKKPMGEQAAAIGEGESPEDDGGGDDE